MTEYKYVCMDCGQQIDVDGTTREAILTNGCPACAAPARVDAFADQGC